MINRTEALRYMGWRGEPDEHISALLNECEAELLKAARPRFVWRVFDIERSEGGITLSGCDFLLAGSDIARHLDGCAKAAVAAATLSADADRLLKRLQLSDSAGYGGRCFSKRSRRTDRGAGVQGYFGENARIFGYVVLCGRIRRHSSRNHPAFNKGC